MASALICADLSAKSQTLPPPPPPPPPPPSCSELAGRTVLTEGACKNVRYPENNCSSFYYFNGRWADPDKDKWRLCVAPSDLEKGVCKGILLTGCWSPPPPSPPPRPPPPPPPLPPPASPPYKWTEFAMPKGRRGHCVIAAPSGALASLDVAMQSARRSAKPRPAPASAEDETALLTDHEQDMSRTCRGRVSDLPLIGAHHRPRAAEQRELLRGVLVLPLLHRARVLARRRVLLRACGLPARQRAPLGRGGGAFRHRRLLRAAQGLPPPAPAPASRAAAHVRAGVRAGARGGVHGERLAGVGCCWLCLLARPPVPPARRGGGVRAARARRARRTWGRTQADRLVGGGGRHRVGAAGGGSGKQGGGGGRRVGAAGGGGGKQSLWQARGAAARGR